MPSLGQRLSEARKQQGLTEEKVSRDTFISLANIRSLESDNYANFDSLVYAKSFLKNYSSYLNLNVSEILVKFDEMGETSEAIFRGNCSRLEDTVKPEETRRGRSPLILAPVLVGIFGFLCFSLFSLFTGGSLPFGPSSSGASPDGETKQAAAQIAPTSVKSVDEDEKVTPIIPVSMKKESDAELEGGPYVDDFHASTKTVFLRPGTPSATDAVLLP